MNCQHCEEPVEGETATQGYHDECIVRAVAGSIGHQLGMCSCFGGSFEDPVELTKRQAAIAAFRMVRWRDSFRRPKGVPQ